MAGEAVSGRYGAARHAVADEDGMRRPAPEDRSLVDRLLGGGGDEHAFDWGWGDPAADREPLHDIPELWGSDGRSPRGSSEPDGAEEKHFPTPRLHGESPRDDDRGLADPGVDALGLHALGDDRGRDDWGAPSPDERIPDAEPGTHDRRFDGPGLNGPELNGPGLNGAALNGTALNGTALDGDPLDALSTGRVHAENGPLGDGSRDREVPDRGPAHDVPMDGDHIGGRAGTDPLDRSPLAPPLSNRDPFDGERSGLDGLGREPGDREPRDREQPHHALFDRDPLGPEPLSPEPPERKLVDADPRLRRWADRNRPSSAPRVDPPITPPPSFADEPVATDALATDRGSDERGADDRGSDELFGPDRFDADLRAAEPEVRDGPAAEPVRDADLFADAASAESVLTGRIRITDADAEGPGPDRAPQEPVAADGAGPASGPDPLDVMPDPTTAFTAVAPAAPARRTPPEAPPFPLEEYTARRRAAEQAAASAEEAEAAAEAAAKAAEQAAEAAQAEVRAMADAVSRSDAPGRPDARADAPEPPTQAVPLIAPARAPGRRLPPRRPAGPPLRATRIDEPGRPPRAAHQQTGPGRGTTDGEATAVLTGLDALRDPVRPRRQEPGPAEATPAARRRPAAEPTRESDDADDPDDADHDDDSADRGVVGRLTSRPVLAALGVGAVLVLAAIVAILTTSEPEAAPAAEPAPAAVTAPVAQQSQPTVAAVNANSQKAVAFLTAMRDADIPTSSSGQAEVEAADAICAQLDQGADEAQLARSVPAVLPNVTRGQASDVVDYAQRFYC